MTRFLADTNVWLGLIISSHRHHRACLRWIDDVEDVGAIVLPRLVQLSVLRLLTTTAVLAPHQRPPLTNAEAWTVMDAVAADERVVLDLEEPPLDTTWRAMSARPTASPKMWMHAYLAAYASTADCTLVTLDGAFAQFPGLTWVNLAA